MPRLPVPGSRSDQTRKAVLSAISKTRIRSIEHLPGRKKTASMVLRVGELEGQPFSRASLYKYGGSAFRKVRHGERTDRHLKPSDRIRRRIDVFSNQRGVELGSVVPGSVDASKVSQHHRAMGLFLSTGDPDYLLRLSEADRTLSDGRVLVGDPDDVQRAADEGRLDDFREAAGS
jgi:hypothetical protein